MSTLRAKIIEYGLTAFLKFRYLCVGNGMRISAAAFSFNIPSWNSERFSCSLGLRDFRQLMITIGHEFISPNETFVNADGILAESADHSVGIDQGHYAVVHGAIPRLSIGTMCSQRWLGHQWDRFLGFGPLPPQAPVRLRSTAADGDTLRSTSDQVAATVKTLLTSFFTNEVKEMLVQTVTSTIEERFPLAGGPVVGSFDVPKFDSQFTLGDLFEDNSMESGEVPLGSPLPDSSIPSPHSSSSDMLPRWDAIPARLPRGELILLSPSSGLTLPSFNSSKSSQPVILMVHCLSRTPKARSEITVSGSPGQ